MYNNKFLYTSKGNVSSDQSWYKFRCKDACTNWHIVRDYSDRLVWQFKRAETSPRCCMLVYSTWCRIYFLIDCHTTHSLYSHKYVCMWGRLRSRKTVGKIKYIYLVSSSSSSCMFDDIFSYVSMTDQVQGSSKKIILLRQ